MIDPELDSLINYVSIVTEPLFRSFGIEVFLGLIVLIVLLFLSALASGSETAYFSLSANQFKDPKFKKHKVDSIIQSFLEIPNRLLATILIINNFINVSIVILSAYLTTQLFNFKFYPVLSFIIQVLVITFLILFFGEIMPKVYAAQHALVFGRFMARPMKFLLKLLYPLSSILVKSTSFIDEKLAIKKTKISRSELSEAIDIAADEDIQERERKILQGIVKFGDIDVTEIMKSRTEVIAIEFEMQLSEIYALILKSGFSRVPVFRESIDNIVGMLYIKDLLPYLDKNDDFEWYKLIRPAFFVPENKKINDLLKEFQNKKIHFAIVVDEYGGTSGIVTLEDVIEEIVGEINDEFDLRKDNAFYTKMNEKSYLFEAKTTINDFCKILDIDDKIFDNVKGDSDSLGGLILEITGKIPDKAEKIPYKNFIFSIESVDKRRIKEVKVIINNTKKS